MTSQALKDRLEELKVHFKANPGVHLFLLSCTALVVAFFIWAYFGKLDVVSIALGEVIPSSQVKSIQHLEGGIVSEILVREGERVEKDQPLIVLESTASGADVQELSVRLASLKVETARLEAELSGADKMVLPEDMLKNHAVLARQAQQMMKTRRTRLDNQIAAQKETIIQRQEEINEIKARLRNSNERLNLLKEQVAISEDLLKDNLTNRMRHLDLLKEVSGVKGSVDEAKALLPKTEAAIKEAQLKLKSIQDAFQEEVSIELEEKRRTLQELSSRMEKFADSLQRTTLRSPVDGVVKTMYVYTVGGVVRPGDTVVDVVPAGDRLVIEAMLAIQDVGYVHPGQTAMVQLASADAVRFAPLIGKVTLVSPDAIEDKEGGAFYKVRIETKQDYFERGSARYKLVPGVQVTSSIQTGTRTILEYLLEPFLRSALTAMRER